METPGEIENTGASNETTTGQRLPAWEMILWVAVAVLAFHAAYAFRWAGLLMTVYLFGLLQLARAGSWRKAWYAGLAAGLLIAAPRLAFFYKIFSVAAIALWMVYAVWIALFVSLARLSLRDFGPKWGWLPIPFLWLGLEYFRSELYYLRFSWLNAGYGFAGALGQVPLKLMGMYGVGFVLTAVAAGTAFFWVRSRIKAMVVMLMVLSGIWLMGKIGGQIPTAKGGRQVRVVGIQMEFPSTDDVLGALRNAVRKVPEAEMIVLSEYTFEGLPPEKIRRWCRDNHRFLVAGGKEDAPGGSYYNTAFVIAPSGEIVFRQVKSVPIQFFKDGRPAPEQKVWESPWGRIGICICYDLSYTRVTDGLVALGAQALVVPTMDVSDWGSDQHELHARVAPVRAAEYGVPIFRLASSGISQCVARDGALRASAPFPGDGAVMVGTLELEGAGTRPLDRWLAPVSVGVTVLMMIWFVGRRIRARAGAKRISAASGARVKPVPFVPISDT